MASRASSPAATEPFFCLAGGEMRSQLTLPNASQGSQLRQPIPPRLRHAALPVVDRLGRHAHHLRKVGSGESKALASRNQPFGDEPNPFRFCWILRRRPGISHLPLQRDHLPLRGGSLTLQVRDLPMVMGRQAVPEPQAQRDRRKALPGAPAGPAAAMARAHRGLDPHRGRHRSTQAGGRRPAGGG